MNEGKKGRVFFYCVIAFMALSVFVYGKRGTGAAPADMAGAILLLLLVYEFCRRLYIALAAAAGLPGSLVRLILSAGLVVLVPSAVRFSLPSGTASAGQAFFFLALLVLLSRRMEGSSPLRSEGTGSGRQSVDISRLAEAAVIPLCAAGAFIFPPAIFFCLPLVLVPLLYRAFSRHAAGERKRYFVLAGLLCALTAGTGVLSAAGGFSPFTLYDTDGVLLLKEAGRTGITLLALVPSLFFVFLFFRAFFSAPGRRKRERVLLLTAAFVPLAGGFLCGDPGSGLCYSLYFCVLAPLLLSALRNRDVEAALKSAGARLKTAFPPAPILAFYPLILAPVGGPAVSFLAANIIR